MHHHASCVWQYLWNNFMLMMVSTSATAINYLERLVSRMSCDVSSGTSISAYYFLSQLALMMLRVLSCLPVWVELSTNKKHYSDSVYWTCSQNQKAKQTLMHFATKQYNTRQEMKHNAMWWKKWTKDSDIGLMVF